VLSYYEYGEAVKLGYVDVLDFLCKHCNMRRGVNICENAAAFGQLAVLQWARANGCEWNAWTCIYAATGGHLGMLQWALANGCPWNWYACSAAARNGHLEVLRWACANGCEWDAQKCFREAARFPLVQQWIRENALLPKEAIWM
jgi:hypothetical protein